MSEYYVALAIFAAYMFIALICQDIKLRRDRHAAAEEVREILEEARKERRNNILKIQERFMGQKEGDFIKRHTDTTWADDL